MDRRSFLASGAALTATAIAGCLAGGSEQAGDHDVGMSTVAFRPATIEVEPGETVVWKNTSKQGHTVTAYENEIPEEADYWASGGFADQSAALSGWEGNGGGALYRRDTYEHTFEVLGEHDYYCIPHESGGMVGTVVVTENPSE